MSGTSGPTQTIYNELRTDISSEAGDALFYKVKDFLLGYQRPTVRKGFLFGAGGALVSLFWVVLHYTVTDSQGEQKLDVRGFRLLLASLFSLLVLLIFSFGNRNYVTLQKRRDAPSFFVRNREGFAVRAVDAVITAIISGVCGFLIGRYHK